MYNITYNLKIVTPVYCKGSDNRKVELRPASITSIKGMMRYWFRALTAERDLNELHKKENKIFGSTKNASKFAIRIRDINLINKKNNLEDYYLLPHNRKKNVMKTLCLLRY